MITFAIRVNGQLAAVAGASDTNVMTAIVTAAGKLGPSSAGSKRRPDGAEIDLYVGAMTAPADASPGEHLRWLRRDLEVGDEISVRVEDSSAGDPPAEREPADSPDAEERRIFEYAREKYFELRAKFEP